MRGLLRYCAGYVLDFFRERVTGADLGAPPVLRVLVTPGFDEQCLGAIHRAFPGASFHTLGAGDGVLRLRGMRFDAACIAMSGGHERARMRALLSGARHKLLVPSPDYLYRFGMRRGAFALAWALVDRFALAPVALVWFGLVAVWMYSSGLVGRVGEAEGG